MLKLLPVIFHGNPFAYGHTLIFTFSEHFLKYPDFHKQNVLKNPRHLRHENIGKKSGTFILRQTHGSLPLRIFPDRSSPSSNLQYSGRGPNCVQSPHRDSFYFPSNLFLASALITLVPIQGSSPPLFGRRIEPGGGGSKLARPGPRHSAE